MHWYINALRNYVGFSGRARRKEYWLFLLFTFLICFLLGFIRGLFQQPFTLVPIYLYVTFLPSLALQVRRLQDSGNSGWLALLGFIPYVGAIIMLILSCLDSQPGPNRYGPNPKAQPASYY